MAKKKAAEGADGFNLSKAIRDVLTENRNLSGREVVAELEKKYPGATINKSSAYVAFSNARKKLGIKGGRRKVRLRKPKGGRVMKAGPARVVLDMDLLKAAKKFVAEVGSAEKAIAAVQQIVALQIG